MTRRETNRSGFPSRKLSVVPNRYQFLLFVLALCGWPAFRSTAHAASTPKPSRADAAKSLIASKYNKIPLSFEANRGQADERIKYLSHGDGYFVSLTPNAAVLQLRNSSRAKPAVLDMELLGANRDAKIFGTDQLPGVSNYFIGNDPAKWHTNVPTFAKVQYRAVYPGIDAVFYGNQRQLEYDFVVAPNADANQIALQITGTTSRINSSGDIALRLGGKDIVLQKPLVYQVVSGKKRVVPASYDLAGNNVRFRLDPYDHTRPLIIDPTFVYLTYLGGSNIDYVGATVPQYGGITPSSSLLSNALAIDSAGSAYVVGSTYSSDFPTLDGYQGTRTDAPPGNWAAFVSKLNPTGTGLVYSTYLGGTTSDNGAAIAVDSAGSAYVVGWSNSKDYPTTAGAYQTSYKSPQSAFVTKLSPAGNSLVYSTLLGGLHYDEAYAIAVDSKGQAYVGGNVFPGGNNGGALDFPQSSDALPSPINEFSSSGFVSVLNAGGSALLYSTQIGDVQDGNTETTVQGVAVDPSGNFYVTGSSSSPSLEVTQGAFQTTLGTSNASIAVAFAAKFGAVNPGKTPLTYLTYLRATEVDFQDWGGAIAVDKLGNAYIAGYTASHTYPTTPDAYQTSCTVNGSGGCFTAFVTKLNPAGTAPVWSTLLGNSVNEYVSSIVLDTLGNIYVAGGAGFSTSPGSFPMVNPVQTVTSNGKGFIAELDPTGSTLLFSSPIGDPGTNNLISGLAVDSLGAIYLGGISDRVQDCRRQQVRSSLLMEAVETTALSPKSVLRRPT